MRELLRRVIMRRSVPLRLGERAVSRALRSGKARRLRMLREKEGGSTQHSERDSEREGGKREKKRKRERGEVLCVKEGGGGGVLCVDSGRDENAVNARRRAARALQISIRAFKTFTTGIACTHKATLQAPAGTCSRLQALCRRFATLRGAG